MTVSQPLLTAIWTLVQLGAILVCLASLAGFFGRTVWFLDLFSHFRLQYLLLLLIATILLYIGGFFLQAITSGFFAILNLLLVIPFYVKEAPAPQSVHANPKQDSYRVLLSNVLQKNPAFGAVRHLIRTSKPDFLVLIEVNKTWIDQLEPALKDLPFSRVKLRDDNYGIAIFSRIPAIFSEVKYFGSAGIPSIVATYSLHQRPVTLLATHPPPPKTRRTSVARNEQLAEIAEYVQTIEGEKLLVGDLNLTSWSPYFSDLTRLSGLRDSRLGFGMQNSWRAFRRWLVIPIDHVLVSAGVVVLARRVGPFIGSDHYPILLDFNLNAQKRVPLKTG